MAPASRHNGQRERRVMAVEAQSKLFEALKAQIAKLEAERDRALGHNQAALDQRFEAAVRVLEWLSTVNPGYLSDSAAVALKRSMSDHHI
jgi:hypothetical protein